MRESSKWCFRAVCCIALFIISAMVGIFFVNDNLIEVLICVAGLFFAFGYGTYSLSMMQSAEKLERHNEMLDENEEYYKKMNKKTS